ncbi:MAG: NAD-dependent epimerase/dehydratase family protein [Acidimicrobiales bacterium]|nr:NAD-dependent epimerase/dehydratase family protein [Acidimicrobiales bacterium]
MARRPFDPAEHGWTKMTYRQGDVRDAEALEAAFEGADVVVHLAFLVTGAAGAPTTRAINVDGTLNAFRAAASAGARRFVYASSVAAYGFHADNPVGMREEWPTRPADRLFYAQEKAELEEALAAAAPDHPELGVYVLRPPVVLGPHVVGGKSKLAGRLLPVGRRAARAAERVPLPLPVLAPDLPIQLIHEADVGSAFLQCIVGAGPPGAYNIAADDVLTAADIVRELGLRPVTVGSGLLGRAARRVASLPVPGFLPQVTSWAEAASHPTVVDISKAKRELHWQPRYSSREALRATLADPS